jgi:uncharacterized membrane protein YidH (DUF202 family)
LPARERTYFSWLRLSTFLCIASIALFLRLRLRVFTSDAPNDDDNDDRRNVTIALSQATNRYAKAIARKALRKHLLRQSAFYLEQFSNVSTATNNETVSLKSQKDILDTDPTLSKGVGIFFFVLAVVALVVGHYDYMRCVRALQDADKLYSSDAEEGIQTSTRIKWHNASSAKKAHSSL